MKFYPVWKYCAYALVVLSSFFFAAQAHELRPAYLSITETQANQYQLLWKTPANADKQLALKPIFSLKCKVSEGQRQIEPFKFAIETWRMNCQTSLKGESLSIEGLDKTLTDVLVRTQWLNSHSQTALLVADKPTLVFDAEMDKNGIVETYFKLGAEHILTGFDHLMFVMAIMLLIVARKRLFWAITAFTLGHSVTLVLASVDVLRISPSIVEPLIAMSIVLMAYEVIRGQRGGHGLTIEHPWIVSFAFGLLHGFGFAGALRAIGLPESDFVFALLFFNIGIEAGQLVFIGFALLLGMLVFRVFKLSQNKLVLPAAYLIGAVSVYWVIERAAGVFYFL